ncbi:MAG: adenosine deaminase [Anaerolineales bacterium]|nr:adenosine deaminase [Anaerolineales bacterium]
MRSINALPKAHLHMHFEGAARPETIIEMARRKNCHVDDLWDFTGVLPFNEKYEQVLDLITQPDDLVRMIHEIVEDQAKQNVVYMEIHIAPRFFKDIFNMPLIQVFYLFLNAFRDASRANGIDFGLILNVNTRDSIQDINSVLNLAVDNVGNGVVSFGISGGEPGLTPQLFADFSKRAHAGGLKVVPHAGETGDPESVWGAVRDLNADRLAHGIRAVEDRELMAYLAAHQIVCDVAISSNVQLNVYPSIEEHPVLELINSGIPVTLNTDNELFFRSSLTNEYEIARERLGLSDIQLANIARTSIRAASISEDKMVQIFSEIDRWLDNSS